MGRAHQTTSDRRSRRFRIAAALAVLALGLAACGQDETSTTTSTSLAPTSTSATTSAATTTTTEAATTTVTTAATATTVAASTTVPPAAALALAVGPDGLILVDQDTGSTTQLPFGTAQDEVVAAVDAALGEAGTATPGNVECANDQQAVAKWSDLNLEFSTDGLIAWSLEPGSSITDMMGITMGSSVADLTAGWDVEIFESTIGTEFFTGDGGGIGGLLSDDTDSATIVSYWGGFICTFR